MKSSGKSEYVLSNAIAIKDEISKYISNIKHILKDDKEEADFRKFYLLTLSHG